MFELAEQTQVSSKASHRLGQTRKNGLSSGSSAESKIAVSDSVEFQDGQMIFARKKFFTESFCALRSLRVQLAPRVAALCLPNTPAGEGRNVT